MAKNRFPREKKGRGRRRRELLSWLENAPRPIPIALAFDTAEAKANEHKKRVAVQQERRHFCCQIASDKSFFILAAVLSVEGWPLLSAGRQLAPIAIWTDSVVLSVDSRV